MADDAEQWELARVINRTEHLLHHQHMKRLFVEVDPDSMPVLTPQQVHMLMTVREHGQMTIKQLTHALHVKAPAVSTMVERLVEMGILTRKDNPADRREVLVRVSPRDESQIQEMERRHLQLTVELFDKIGMKYARAWADLCRRIQEVLAEEDTS
jgi:DNA-binding MarR family transcriptional regulator